MKKLFYLSISVNVLFAAFLVAKRIYYSNSGKIDWHAIADKNNEEKTKLFASFSITNNDIVFIGNSLTEAFPVAEFFNAKNRGISGNTILHLISRIDQVVANHPRKLFIEIGINDINRGDSMRTIKLRYLSLIDLIKERSPETIIYIQSVLPTCYEFDKANAKVIELNNFLESIKRENLTYIDVYSSFAVNGKLNERLTTDGIHPNYEGYTVWYNAIKGYAD